MTKKSNTTNPIPESDARLLELFDQFEHAHRRLQDIRRAQGLSSSKVTAEEDELTLTLDSLKEAVLAIPAQSVRGIAIKMAMDPHFQADWGKEHPLGSAYLRSAFSDALRLSRFRNGRLSTRRSREARYQAHSYRKTGTILTDYMLSQRVT